MTMTDTSSTLTTATTPTATTAPWTYADVRGAYQGDRLIAFAERQGLATGDADPIPLPALLRAGYLRGERDAYFRLGLVAGLLARSHRAVLVRWAGEVSARARARLGALPARADTLATVIESGADPSRAGSAVPDLLGQFASVAEVQAKRAQDVRAGGRAYGQVWAWGVRRLVALLDEAGVCALQAAA